MKIEQNDMKFETRDVIINIKHVEGLKILTTLTIQYVGDLEFYPFSNKIGDGYHMRYYPWEEMALDSIFSDFFIKEDELEDRFIHINELTKNHEIAIKRDQRIDEIFKD